MWGNGQQSGFSDVRNRTTVFQMWGIGQRSGLSHVRNRTTVWFSRLLSYSPHSWYNTNKVYIYPIHHIQVQYEHIPKIPITTPFTLSSCVNYLDKSAQPGFAEIYRPRITRPIFRLCLCGQCLHCQCFYEGIYSIFKTRFAHFENFRVIINPFTGLMITAYRSLFN